MPNAFGKFHAKQPILLEDGLNIIVGDNESGKSTLASFIIGMFYGFKKEGLIRISRTPEFERYRPWFAKEYRGIITYESEGTVYRVERWFDPDIIKIYNDTTGENITHKFTQDSRKEYNFAQTHLGLSAKEFRNTIWIGQLASAQDEDLGLEIQGKLENILQGGEEDVPFAKALSVLYREIGKIQTPRSTRAKLDIIQNQKAELVFELNEAKVREQQIRNKLVTLLKVKQEEIDLSETVSRSSQLVDMMRIALLKKTMCQARELEQRISELQDRLVSMEWAKSIPANLPYDLPKLTQDLTNVDIRIQETKTVIKDLTQEEESLKERFAKYESTIVAELTQDRVSALHSQYLTCKAGVARAERHANETRKVLRDLEEQAKSLTIPCETTGQDLLATAESLQSIVMLAEREKSRLDMEVEKAKTGMAHAQSATTGGWFYALSLGMLGIAIALTIIGLPLASIAFGISIVVFGIGTYRQRKALSIKAQAEDKYNLAVNKVNAQSIKVDDAKRTLKDYLRTQNVNSVEKLRLQVQNTIDFNRRLINAKDKYDLAHRYWYETSQELAEVEKELTAVLVDSRCLIRGQAITGKSVIDLKTKLREVIDLKSKLENVNRRRQEFQKALLETKTRKESLERTKRSLLDAAGVLSLKRLQDMVVVNRKYVDESKTLEHLKEKLETVLSGRRIEEIEREVDQSTISSESIADLGQVSEKSFQDAQKQLGLLQKQLGEIKGSRASLEKEVILRQRKGRTVCDIQEELDQVIEIEEELIQDNKALSLALETLQKLSKNLRREFVPMINQRVGQILKQVTCGKYVDARVSPDLDLNIIHPRRKTQTPIGGLSCGTIDQCYFALRVAVAEIITAKPTFPFFFDDSFVLYDDRRLEGALKVLSEISAKHQVLLFSCRGRELFLADNLKLPYNVVDLNRLDNSHFNQSIGLV